MPETQDKIGTLTETSRNNIKRGGREIPDEPQDGKLGTLHKESRNSKPRGGPMPGPHTADGGIRTGLGDIPSVRRANDHIHELGDQY